MADDDDQRRCGSAASITRRRRSCPPHSPAPARPAPSSAARPPTSWTRRASRRSSSSTSEVVTNALLHGRDAPRLVVACRGHTVRVSVEDADPRWPTRQSVAETELAGPGHRPRRRPGGGVGVERLDQVGKRVWFEVREGQEWPAGLVLHWEPVTVSRPGGRGQAMTWSRKVGAPQGRVLANGQSGRPAGKCHRKQTADGRPPGRHR